MKTSLRWAAIFAVVHVVLALLYASATPYMKTGVLMNQRDQNRQPLPVIDVGAPDELQHIVYVQRIANGEGFPVLDPKDPELGRNYQSHQPPLYYLLAAGWSKVFGNSALGMRSLNALIGGITVLGVFVLAYRTTDNEVAAWGAAAFAALLPMQIALSGAVSNDPLLFCLCTWTLALAAGYLRELFCIKRAAFLGLIVGLAILTKTTAIALFPALLVGYMLTKERPRVSRVAVTLATSLIVCGAWWARNQQLYGDPLAMGVFATAFQGSPKADTFIQLFGAPIYWLDYVGWWTMRSFVGAFGYMDVFLADNLYRGVFAALCFFGLAGAASLRNSEQKGNGALHWMNFAFFLAVFALFVMFNRTYFQGQARYLLPAIGPIAVAVGLGAATLVQGKPKVGTSIVAAGLLALNLFILSKLPQEFATRVTQTNQVGQTSN